MAHTLLLGLGGTGSRVVAKVAKELEKSDIAINDGIVCCAVMDTDKNDMDNLLKKAKIETEIPVVATSSPNTVGDILRLHPQANEWCINDVKLFLGETMTNGASTMRMKSRLAFLHTYKGSKISTIEELISKMMTTGDGLADLQVMLVSSISGGTGAGMFIQTALWIRNIFKERNKEIKLRGMLLLPDIFVKTVKDVSNNDFLEDRHYANAYAAIREMNAISKIKLDSDYKPKVPVKIDNLFDSEDMDNPQRSPKDLFDFIFFVDYENKSGANLKSIVDYEDLVAQLTYMQFYSPMKDAVNTKEDNLFLNNVRLGFSFGSCGTAKAVYPKDNVMEYCVLRTVSDMISDGWRNLDAEIEAIQMQEKAKKNAGEQVPNPVKPVEKYVSSFENKAGKNTTSPGYNPFFASLKNEAPKEKAADFLKGLKEKISAEIDEKNKDDQGFSALDALGVSLEESEAESNEKSEENSKEKSSKKVSKTDLQKYTVESLKKTIDSNTQAFNEAKEYFDTNDCYSIASDIIDSVFTRIVDELNMNNTQSVYGMLTTVDENTGTRSFVHPVAMRYLLYKLQSAIAVEKVNVEAEKTECVQEFEALEENIPFDYKRTKRVESLDNYFKEAPRRFEGNETDFRAYFIQQYRSYIRAQYACAKDYENKTVYILVLQELYSRLTKLIKNMENFFDKLPVIVADAEKEIQNNLKASLQKTNVTYVCASEAAKKYIYDSLDIEFDGSDRITNRLIIDSIYGMLCAEAIPGHKSNEKYKNFNIVEAFKKGVRDYYSEKIMTTQSEKVDLDIYSALKTEMLSKGDHAYDKAMTTLVATIEHGAEPYLQYLNNEEEQITYTFWGYHPGLAEAYPNLGSAIGGNAQSQSDEVYPKNELVCYRTVYNVDVPHFYKFNENKNSNYYKEYCDIVYKMADSKSKTLMQTPHLDKTWHNVLPYLTAEKQAEEDARLYRGILYGFAYGRLRLNNNNVYEILRGVSEWKELREGNDLVKKAEVSDLFRILMKDGTFLHHDIAFLEEKFAKEIAELDKYEGKQIYDYLTKPSETHPVKLLVSYHNCSDKNIEIKDGIIKAIEDIMQDLFAAYDRLHSTANRDEAEYLRKIYDACNCKGKENVFVSWADALKNKAEKPEAENAEEENTEAES